MPRKQPQLSLSQRLHRNIWKESWTKFHAWLTVGGASLGATLHTLANDPSFKDALSKFQDIPPGVWIGLAIIGATTWVSAEHD